MQIYYNNNNILWREIPMKNLLCIIKLYILNCERSENNQTNIRIISTVSDETVIVDTVYYNNIIYTTKTSEPREVIQTR